VEKIKQEREEMDKKRNQTAWLGGSILDRNSPRNPNNPNAMITLPANYTLDTAPARDTSTTNSAPASFDVPVIQVNSGEASGTPKRDENDNERLVTNSLLVPDRVSMEYKDDDEETEARAASTSSSSAGISMAVPVIAVSSEATSVTILLSKKRTSLGWLNLTFSLYGIIVTVFKFCYSTVSPCVIIFHQQCSINSRHCSPRTAVRLHFSSCLLFLAFLHRPPPPVWEKREGN